MQNAEANTAMQTSLSEWEDGLSKTKWDVLFPRELKANSGALLQLRKDGSVLVSGAKKVTDEYQLKIQTSLEKITALRIELLSDDSLPQNGPSRNHNLVLNEVILNSKDHKGIQNSAKKGKFVRMELPGKDRILYCRSAGFRGR